jgi:hypothetical protein
MENMKRKIGGRQFVLADFSFDDRVLLAKFLSLSMPHTHSNFIIHMMSFLSQLFLCVSGLRIDYARQTFNGEQIESEIQRNFVDFEGENLLDSSKHEP